MFIGGNSGIRVTFHGVRGSTPCSGDEVRRYGGNTSCVSIVAPGEQPILLDLGTGLRYFGNGRPPGETFRGTCLLTHLHWDHAQGLPFFKPVLTAGAELDIYGPEQEDGRSLADAVRTFLSPPHFPVPVEAFPGKIRFHDLADDDFQVGGVSIRSRMIPHCGNTLGYRVTVGGVSIAYLPDHQQPIDGSFSTVDNVRQLIDGVDLLIHDAQYTPEEFALKRDWGHCTPDFAAWLADLGQVRSLALFHHDPVRTDQALDELERRLAAEAAPAGRCVFAAHEGQSLLLLPA